MQSGERTSIKKSTRDDELSDGKFNLQRSVENYASLIDVEVL